MPLRDHFHPPLSEIHSWDELHGGWPMVIVQQLGDKLPANYVAVPRVHLGAEAEIDVGAFDQDGDRDTHVSSDQGSVATAQYRLNACKVFSRQGRTGNAPTTYTAMASRSISTLKTCNPARSTSEIAEAIAT